MSLIRGYRLGGVAVALSLSVILVGVVHAQQDAPVSGGIVLGEIDRCNSGTETPVPGVSVGVDGGSGSLATTDSGGQFVLNLAAGTYTVVATAGDGSTASRPYVPVEGGVAIDIGVLDLGSGAGGCGGDAGVPAAPTVAPTLAPTGQPTGVSLTATAVPQPTQPTPTPQPTGG
jgi:hypothetical protein